MAVAGFLTFRDPPKPDAKETIAKLEQLGVMVKVLTGDNALVARNVCGQIGLDTRSVLTGEQLYGLPLDENDQGVGDLFVKTAVFARLNPSQKSFVVAVLRKRGYVVGFLGDGINDTLGLREADVGITVETASDLAKDASDIILTEKSLSTIHQVRHVLSLLHHSASRV